MFFVKCSSVGVPQMCCLDETGVTGFEKEDHRDNMSFSLYHIKVIYYQYDLPLFMLILMAWLKVVFTTCSPRM